MCPGILPHCNIPTRSNTPEAPKFQNFYPFAHLRQEEIPSLCRAEGNSLDEDLCGVITQLPTILLLAL